MTNFLLIVSLVLAGASLDHYEAGQTRSNAELARIDAELARIDAELARRKAYVSRRAANCPRGTTYGGQCRV